MKTAEILTVGTEITGGEVVNTNAAWLAVQLENAGLRVTRHVSVRDQRDEMRRALDETKGDFLVVTGGLGPTSDDLTREMLAAWVKQPLEFDDQVWAEFQAHYSKRGLPIREAHRHQCWFPKSSERLSNPVGTALGFRMIFGERVIVALPGPPRELQGMFQEHIQPQLSGLGDPFRRWLKWTLIGSPESEVAELVEPIIQGTGLEVGYRAQVPYVRLKLYADPVENRQVIKRLEEAIQPFNIGTGEVDLAVELLQSWPLATFNCHDSLTEFYFFQRLQEARATLRQKGGKFPILKGQCSDISQDLSGFDCVLCKESDHFHLKMKVGSLEFAKSMQLPYQIPLESERGRRSATEWCLYWMVSALKSKNS
ncbi:MAG: competence/damage-inducible protein A [Bdellovibrionales bacterium]